MGKYKGKFYDSLLHYNPNKKSKFYLVTLHEDKLDIVHFHQLQDNAITSQIEQLMVPQFIHKL